jgi:UDP-3-O-[3-hydroxymyristoyl] N-acetylglucosamine deacetylase
MIFFPTAENAPAPLPWEQPWTVAETLQFTGVGLHTGAPVTLTIVAAPAGTGLVFRRCDLPGMPSIPASLDHVSHTQLSTTLAANGASVQTVEHLLAALWGMGVSDAWLELNGPEVPILDGSAAPFATALARGGLRALAGRRPTLQLAARRVDEGDRSVEARPADECRISIKVDYSHPQAGAQSYTTLLSPAIFEREIAPARTFGFLHEVEALQAAGFARGGSTLNAVVISETGTSSPLRFADEFVRHKALDLMGDLALLGARWSGHVVAVKAGHGLHVALARELCQPLQREPQEVT